VLKTLPSESVHCCITSPPYFNLRDYKVDGQIGLERTPDEYVAQLVAVFREVRKVLRKGLMFVVVLVIIIVLVTVLVAMVNMGK
jgi:DNA modification methylase